MSIPDPPVIIYPELSYKITEAAYEVHNTLGPGFLEKVYEEALAHEFQLRKVPFIRQRPIEIYYKGRLIGKHSLDLVVDNKVILELKAVGDIADIFKAQTKSYLKATQLKLGIIINFGTKKFNLIVL